MGLVEILLDIAFWFGAVSLLYVIIYSLGASMGDIASTILNIVVYAFPF